MIAPDRLSALVNRWRADAQLLTAYGDSRGARACELPAEQLTEVIGGVAAGSAAGVGEQLADLTAEEVGRAMGRAPGTVRDWIRAGRLPAYLLNGREYRIRREDLHAFQRLQREQAAAAPGSRRALRGDLGDWRKERSSSIAVVHKRGRERS